MKFATIEEYISSAEPETREILRKIRSLVKGLVPAAEETISYQIPAFRLGRVFFYFAAFKSHIGIYPPVKGDPRLREQLKPFRNEKGNLRFPLSEPVPYELIGRVVLALVEEYAKKPKA